MWRYKLIKLTRAIRIFFGGYKAMEEKHKLFRLPEALTPREIAERFMPHQYYYNVASSTYRKQIYTVRRLVDLDHQYHLRFYSNGWVSGHYELRPEAHPLEHLGGVDLRSLTDRERGMIQGMAIKLPLRYYGKE